MWDLSIAVDADEGVAGEHLDERTELLELQSLGPHLLAMVDGHLHTGAERTYSVV